MCIRDRFILPVARSLNFFAMCLWCAPSTNSGQTHFTKLRKSVGDEIENLSRFFNTIGDDLTQIIDWSNEFSQESKIILNYGDLLISFPPNTLDKEDSAKIVSDFKYAIKKKQYTEALALVEFLINRWSKIEFANQKDINKSTN